MASDEGLVAQAAPSTPAVSVLEPAADAGAHGGAAEQSRFMLLSSCESIFQTFSGPAQYLQANLKEPCDVVDFRNWLRNTFPEAEDTLYSADEKLPKVPAASQDYACQQPLCIHVSALGFTGDCTLKPPPGGEFCKCLLEEILMDGFQSASDPLLVLQHEPDCAPLDLPCGDHGQLRAFSLAYVKGYTRAVTLLTALHRCKVLGLDGRTDEGLKPLWNSVTKVFVHCVEQPSRLDEALQNMKLSARGSLRRANNTIQCCFIIRNLKGKCGLVDSSVFVKRWNAMSSKAFQIVGKRSLALKQLLDQTPEETLNLILAHVNAYGWQNSCWSDDSLAVKKLYPGYQFACTKKSWLSRMKTTEESMDLCVRHLQSTFERKSGHLRQKADPQTVEDVSLACCSVLASGTRTSEPGAHWSCEVAAGLVQQLCTRWWPCGIRTARYLDGQSRKLWSSQGLRIAEGIVRATKLLETHCRQCRGRKCFADWQVRFCHETTPVWCGSLWDLGSQDLPCQNCARAATALMDAAATQEMRGMRRSFAESLLAARGLWQTSSWAVHCGGDEL